MALLTSGDGGGTDDESDNDNPYSLTNLGLEGDSGGSDTSTSDTSTSESGGSGGGGVIGDDSGGSDTSTSDSDEYGSGDFSFTGEEWADAVQSSRDEEDTDDAISVGNKYYQPEDDGGYEKTWDKEGDNEYNQDELVEPTLLGDGYTEEQKANDRPLEETLSAGDEPYMTGTGLPEVDEQAREMDSVDTVTNEEASEGYTANEGTDQTPDRDVYEHGGTEGYEEVSASPSDTAEQDPSLDGSGVVTGSDGTAQWEEPDPSETPVPSPNQSADDSGGSGGPVGSGLSGGALAAALVAVAAVAMGVGR